MNNIYYKNKYLKYKNKYLIKKIKLNLGGSIETINPSETTCNSVDIIALVNSDQYQTVVRTINTINYKDDILKKNDSEILKDKLDTIWNNILTLEQHFKLCKNYFNNYKIKLLILYKMTNEYNKNDVNKYLKAFETLQQLNQNLQNNAI